MKRLVASYLFAAVAANLAVYHFGPWALPFTAFVLIPFDLVARDALHERWEASGRVWMRMAGLVLAGSFLSVLVNLEAHRVALASFLAFAAAGAVDTIVYAVLRGQPRLARMNTSNVFSSVTDSIVFPLVAFGVFDLALLFSQSTAKILGGALWSIAFHHFMKRRHHAHRHPTA